MKRVLKLVRENTFETFIIYANSLFSFSYFERFFRRVRLFECIAMFVYGAAVCVFVCIVSYFGLRKRKMSARSRKNMRVRVTEYWFGGDLKDTYHRKVQCFIITHNAYHALVVVSRGHSANPAQDRCGDR
jgi:hypothetical protein